MDEKPIKPFAEEIMVQEVKVSQNTMAVGPKSSFEKTELLCMGFIRSNFHSMNRKNINPFDVGTIVIRLLGIDTKKCRFIGGCKFNSHKLIIFNNANLTHQKIKGYKTFGQANPLIEQFPTNTMTIQRIGDHSCKSELYLLNNGYCMQCGIIEVIKSGTKSNGIPRMMLQPAFYDNGNLSTLKPASHRACQNQRHLKKNPIYLQTYYLHFWYYKYNLDRYWCSFGKNTKWDEKVLYNTDIKTGDRIRDYKLHGTVLNIKKDGTLKHDLEIHDRDWGDMHDVRIMNSDRIGIKWEGNAKGSRYDGKLQRNEVRLLQRKGQNGKNGNNENNKDNDSDSKDNGDYNNEFILTEKDRISVVIDNAKKELYFYKNNAKNKKIGNIRQKLDFDKYDYYFAMASVGCNCNGEKGGFEYDVSVHL